jgi:hypothetical protein
MLIFLILIFSFKMYDKFDISNLISYQVISSNLTKNKTLVLVGEFHEPKNCTGHSYGSLLFDKINSKKDNKKRCLYVESTENLEDRDQLRGMMTPIKYTIYYFYDHQNRYKNNIKLQPIEQRFFENIFSVFTNFYLFVDEAEELMFNIEKLSFLSKLNSWKELKIIFDCFFDEKGIIEHMKTIDNETKKSYAELYPNIVEILENEKWIYNDLVVIENNTVISKQMHRISKLKNNRNYQLILRSINKFYENHCKTQFSELYKFEKSPKKLYQELVDCIYFYNFITDDHVRMMPNIFLLKTLKFGNKNAEIKRNYYIKFLEDISLSLLTISSVILDLEFISQFLTNDEDIGYFIAGNDHIVNVYSFFLFIKGDKECENCTKLIVDKYKKGGNSIENCNYLYLSLDEII